MFRRVAIIGGGAAAASLVSELAERNDRAPLAIDWFTGSAQPGRGIAYATRSPQHLLNVRAASMSLYAARPRGFLDFVQQDDPALDGTAFLPRARYGDYLEAEVAHAFATAEQHGHYINTIPFHADALVPEPARVTVIQGETQFGADAAVLAIGALPPRPLPGVAAAAVASGRYVVDPWPYLATAPAAPAPRRVLVVGLGLTAVDVLVELAQRWPAAHFTAISRHGLLPEVHGERAAAPFDEGGELVDAMGDAPSVRYWLHLVREAIALDRCDWRAVIDGLRPYLAGLWAELPGEERARFLRHLRWAWERVRHRMAPQVHAALEALERDGRLERRAARLESVTVAGEALAIGMRHGAATTQATADLVIQATGLDTDVRATAHRLVSQLLTNAHIRPDPLGLGLAALPDGRLLRGDAPWPNLFALGSLLRGTLWESTAMPEIRQQARQLANRLCTA